MVPSPFWKTCSLRSGMTLIFAALTFSPAVTAETCADGSSTSDVFWGGSVWSYFLVGAVGAVVGFFCSTLLLRFWSVSAVSLFSDNGGSSPQGDLPISHREDSKEIDLRADDLLKNKGLYVPEASPPGSLLAPSTSLAASSSSLFPTPVPHNRRTSTSSTLTSGNSHVSRAMIKSNSDELDSMFQDSRRGDFSGEKQEKRRASSVDSVELGALEHEHDGDCCSHLGLVRSSSTTGRVGLFEGPSHKAHRPPNNLPVLPIEPTINSPIRRASVADTLTASNVRAEPGVAADDSDDSSMFEDEDVDPEGRRWSDITIPEDEVSHGGSESGGKSRKGSNSSNGSNGTGGGTVGPDRVPSTLELQELAASPPSQVTNLQSHQAQLVSPNGAVPHLTEGGSPASRLTSVGTPPPHPPADLLYGSVLSPPGIRGLSTTHLVLSTSGSLGGTLVGNEGRRGSQNFGSVLPGLFSPPSTSTPIFFPSPTSAGGLFPSSISGGAASDRSDVSSRVGGRMVNNHSTATAPPRLSKHHHHANSMSSLPLTPPSSSLNGKQTGSLYMRAMPSLLSPHSLPPVAPSTPGEFTYSSGHFSRTGSTERFHNNSGRVGGRLSRPHSGRRRSLSPSPRPAPIRSRSTIYPRRSSNTSLSSYPSRGY